MERRIQSRETDHFNEKTRVFRFGKAPRTGAGWPGVGEGLLLATAEGQESGAGEGTGLLHSGAEREVLCL